MKGLMDQLHTLGKPYDNDMAVNLINRSLNKDFGDFVRNFNMHCVGKTVSDLHALLIDYEKGLKDKVTPTPQGFNVKGNCLGGSISDYWAMESQAVVEAIANIHYLLKTLARFRRAESLGPPPELIRSVEPANYRAAMIDPDKVLWQGAMDEEMKSMKVNKVWIVVDRPPNAKVVRSKWLYKKKMTRDDLANVMLKRLLECRLDEGHLYGATEVLTIDLILKKFNMQNLWNGFYRWSQHVNLSNEMCASSDEEKAYMKRVPYASAVGSIMYAVRCTRPDVAFAQNLVSRYQQNPGKLHWVAVKHILKYLRNTKDMFLVYGGNPDTELDVTFLLDASGNAIKMIQKSQTGYVFVVNGGAVDWKSKKQTTIAMHATQSEYMAASEAAMEAVWIRKFVEDLGVMPSISKPINMYCDNSAAIIFANDLESCKGASHFLRRISLCFENKREW
ncbi:hypothetical protein Tco_1387128 [Tanacetum coccineum]